MAKKTRKKVSAEVIRKKSYKQEREERDIYNFNEGRLNADRKWIQAIDERIEELEKQAGIPELRLLKKKTMYRWNKVRNSDASQD